MKIYFCGSIKGGRELVDTYSVIINLLKKYGDVLTEHIGDSKYALSGYSPSRQVFLQDSEWLKSADIVVAEITTASMGVGYELGMAEALNKKTYCLYQSDKKEKISSMILGNEYFEIFSYETTEELPKIINGIFAKEI
ncbi:MAG TPA: nucleoside 2-deoxyribosyltransferase [Clostridia bacterium]|nr:nucleoside 2-deoxyribosyltransferase [Clostridia bacterium]